MKLNKRLTIGIISIISAALIALIGIPAVIGQSKAQVNIVRVKTAIEKGSVITAEQLELSEVSIVGLTSDTVTDTEQVIGKYALVDLIPGDHILMGKIGEESPEKDLILKKLPEGKVALSVSVKSFAGMLSNKLQNDDIVAIYTLEKNEPVKPDELQYMRIIAITNANGINVEDATVEESRIASTITFLADELQAEKLISIEYNGSLHMALVSRGDKKRAKELLEEQDKILEDIRSRPEENENGETIESYDEFSENGGM